MPLAAIFIALVFSLLTGASVQRLQHEALYRSANAAAADARLLVRIMESYALNWTPNVGCVENGPNKANDCVFDHHDVPITLAALHAKTHTPIPLNYNANVYRFINIVNLLSGNPDTDPMRFALTVDLERVMGPDEAKTVALNAAIAVGGGALANKFDFDNNNIFETTDNGTFVVPIPALYAAAGEINPWLPRTGLLPMTGPLKGGLTVDGVMTVDGDLKMESDKTLEWGTSSNNGVTHITAPTVLNSSLTSLNIEGNVWMKDNLTVNDEFNLGDLKFVEENEALVLKDPSDAAAVRLSEAGLVYGKTGQFDVLSTPNFEYQP